LRLYLSSPTRCKPYTGWGILIAVISVLCSKVAIGGIEADPVTDLDFVVPGYLARIERNDPAEVEQALRKAEQYYLDNRLSPTLPKIAFVLHGPEIEIFFRDNYSRYKTIVDLAARLSAFKVVDIKVCRKRLRFLEKDVEQLFPFVGSVPFGPAEIKRLVGGENFVYF
jgi:uncharacterized protein